MLKQKFRQLYHLKFRNIEFCVHFIRAVAVLHNMSIGDEFEDFIVPEDIHPQNEANLQDVDDEQQDDRNGIMRRNEVMNGLPFRM